MSIFFYYGVLYFLIGFFSLALSLCIFFYNSYVLDVGVFFIGLVDFKFLIVFDFYSTMFFSVLMMICGSVYFFSSDYMFDVLNLRFMKVLNVFVLSMIFLVFFLNMFWVLIGWDGLGMTSVLLVFYYYSKQSWSSGFKTYLMNRLGDGFLIVSVVFMFLKKNLMMVFKCILLCLVLLLGLFTKSSQFPFSSWLPVAMSAPTPVSALVHSSTLVTAGVFLMVRFGCVFSYLDMFYMSVVGLFTMVYASLSCIFDWDLKKIMAYSTLSQLGLMCYMFGLGLIDFCFFHLIIHALFKALLFISGGYVLLLSSHMQDLRFIGLSGDLFGCVFLFVNFCLSGVVFFSGFYTKDMVLEGIKNMNVFLGVLFFLSIFLTSVYSFRLYFWCFSGLLNGNVFMSFVVLGKVYFSIFFLMFLSFLMGSFFFNNVEVCLCFFFIGVWFKILIILIIFFGFMLKLFFLVIFSYFFSNIFYLESLKSSFYMKWLSSMSLNLYNIVDMGLLDGLVGSFGSSVNSVSLKMNFFIYMLKVFFSYLNFYVIGIILVFFCLL